MAVRSGIGINVQDLAASASDAVILPDLGAGNRAMVTGLSIYNTTGGNAVVEIYESPDNTSAAGTLVATLTIATASSEQPVECIGQGYAAGRRLVAVVTTGGLSAGDLTAKVTYTLYNAGS